ncbi:MAG: ABC transporter ATP-binding protein [Erythrobacter sp.]|jgi:iron complex transport system ATP-binding protein|nr:ABC transporter ATP-binding protein [Erythrobacter sp.]
MSALEASGLTYRAGSRALVSDASFALEPGTLTMLIGPNGAGKTTLLRLALGLLEPAGGQALIGGSEARTLSPPERARRAAYLPQARPLIWPQPVRDIVALGRFSHGAVPGRLSADDAAAVARAIAACGLEGLEERAADTLSGGELSRVHLARALAAEAPVLAADEPVAALDPRYSHEVLRIFLAAARAGAAVLTVIHDLALAARYADRLLWMQEGRIVADGTPGATLTPDRLAAVFAIDAEVTQGPADRLHLLIKGPTQGCPGG